MAISYQSFAYAEDRNCNPLTINKPTGLAAGDLLVVYLSNNNGSGSGTWTTPTNWTNVTSAGNTGTWVACMAKVADSADAAASNFSFTSNGAGDGIGILLRVSGTFSNPANNIVGTSNISGLTTTGVDPSLGGALFMFGSIATAGTAGGVFSTYAVTTDNPTWTEIVDDRYNDLREIHFFASWGTRSASTATGNSSVLEEVGGTNYGGILIALMEDTSASGNHTLLTMTSEVFDNTINLSTTGSHNILAMSSNVFDSSMEVDQWSGQSKTSATWTNQNKS